MATIDFEQILKQVPNFGSEKKYWFVRTSGGDYYKHFKDGNFIAIGFDEIQLYDIAESKKNEKKPFDFLVEAIKSRDKENTKPMYAAQQLMKFAYEIKKGDIVVIPSYNSFLITFGIVEETASYIEENAKTYHKKHDFILCPYQKRKKVTWVKEMPRHKLDSNLYKAFFSHHIITEITQYANYVNNTLSNFYISNNEATIILEVQTNHDIPARGLFQMGNTLLDVLEDFCKINNISVNTDAIDVKLNVQSPGKIQLSSTNKTAITIIGLLVIGTVGGGFKIHYGDFELDLSTNGLIQKVIDYQNNEHNRGVKQQLLDKHMKTLQIQQPDDLIKVLQVNNDENNKVKSPLIEGSQSQDNTTVQDSTGTQP